MSTAVQRSFTGGEIAPTLYGRADMSKVMQGLRTCRNFIAIAAGAALNRAGFKYIGEVKDSAAGPPRLLPFVFNDSQTYVIELGAIYGRLWKNGGRVSVSGVAAWNIATNYVLGDLVSRLGVNYYCLLAHVGNQPPNATYWRALSGSIYEFSAPYDLASTINLKLAQSADVVTLVQQGYAPRELARTAETHWAITVIAFGAGINPPAAPAAVAGTPVGGGGGATTPANPTISSAVGGNAVLPLDYYIVTAWNGLADAPEIYESAGSPAHVSSVGGADAGNHVVVTWAAGGVGQTAFSVYKLFFPYYRRIADVNGTTLVYTDVGVADPGAAARQAPVGPSSVNAYSYVITSISDSTGNESIASAVATCTGAIPTATAPNSILWNAVTGSTVYNVYRVVDGTAGYIGTATGTGVVTFHDIGITPDTTVRPPTNPITFSSANDYPATVAYYQQRLSFADTLAKPDGVWLSRVGAFHDFSLSTPVEDDDAVNFRTAGSKVNEVRHLVSLNTLFLFTSGGEWTANGGADGGITPSAPNLRQQGYRGASSLAPIPIENTALYIQGRGSIVRDLVYDLNSDGYHGRDLSIFSSHLFENHTIVDWAFQQIPYSVVWAVRDDGVLLALTYVKEHEVWAWHRHDSGDGDAFERVCCVPEGTEDALYAVVKRVIGGVTKRYVERMHTRVVTDIATDAFFVDSGITYDGRNTGATTLAASGGTTWVYTESLTLTASVATFTAADVGRSFVVTIGTETVAFTVVAYLTTTTVTVKPNRTVPASMRAVASAVWARAQAIITGLDHLEGRTVSALNDGNVERDLVVTGGQVTLGRSGSVVHVGLPITADLETLDLEDPTQPTRIDKKQRVNRVTLLVESARGVLAGPDADSLTEGKTRYQEEAGAPTALLTGKIDVNVQASWNDNGRVFVRHQDPLPLSILSVAPTGIVSG